MTSRRLSVRGRITVVATAVVALTLVLVSLLIVELVEDDVRESSEQALAEALETQAAEYETLLANTSGPIIAEPFVVDVFDETGLEVGIFEEIEPGLAFGEFYVGSDTVAGLLIETDTGEVVEVLDPLSGEPTDDPFLVDFVEDFAFQAQPVEGIVDAGGVEFVVAASSLDDIASSTSAVRRALLVTVPAVVLAFALLTWWLLGRALRPVHAITSQVGSISNANLDERVPVPPGDDEVTELANVMNGMLARLEAGDARQKQFAADASHELRSPLSTIRTSAEIIERRPDGERTPALADHILAEADRMDSLIDDLLRLARDENAPAPTDAIDLATVVRDGADHDPDALLDVATVQVLGDRSDLERVVRNLVDNARRHATAQVQVGLRRIDDVAVLWVDDDGPGVEPADRQRVFERFTRLDDARSRNDGGAGLGLSLCKSIVTRHRGTIAVEDAPALGGARVVVRLPAAEEAADALSSVPAAPHAPPAR